MLSTKGGVGKPSPTWQCQKRGGGGGRGGCDPPVNKVFKGQPKVKMAQKESYIFPRKVTIHTRCVNVSPEIILIPQNMSIYSFFIDLACSPCLASIIINILNIQSAFKNILQGIRDTNIPFSFVWIV